jgi:hypothetical protein
MENLQNASSISANTSVISDKTKDLFEEQNEKKEDLFNVDTKLAQSLVGSIKKVINNFSIIYETYQ